MWMHTAQLILFALLRLLHNPAMRRHLVSVQTSDCEVLRSQFTQGLFRHVTHHCLIYAVLPFAYDELLIKVLITSREELVLYRCDRNNSMNELT